MHKNHFAIFRVLLLVVSFVTLLFGTAGSCRAEASVTGVWQLNANNFKGIMQIRGNPGAYHGQIKFDDIGKWEDMLDLKVQGTNISFRRAHANQKYFSTSSNENKIEGKFNQEGTGVYQWSAVKTAGGGGDSRGAIIAGNYNLVANNYTGVMQIRDNSGTYHGQMKFDDIGKWEQMLDLHISGNGISFRRANANQKYKGSIRGGSITGVFNQDGSGNFQWKADKK